MLITFLRRIFKSLLFFRDGWWDVSKLRYAILENLVQKIISWPAKTIGARKDKLIWGCTLNGTFTVNTTYNVLHDCERMPVFYWFGIWTLKSP